MAYFAASMEGARSVTAAMNIETSGSDEEHLLEEGTAAPASSGTRLFMRRVVQPIGVALAAAAIGYAGYEGQIQMRLRDPVQPTATGLAHTDTLDGFTELTQMRTMENGWCPAHGLHPWVRCAKEGTCCNNNQGNAYCCAEGNLCFRQVCIAAPGQCFPGEAEVELQGGLKKRLNELTVGENILVETAARGKHFEPVIAFLHDLPGNHASLTVEHESGSFRVSANHLVFAQDGQGKRADKIANQLTAGDVIYQNGHAVKVLSVYSSVIDSGMYAPLTASGTVVVDGVAASNYATSSLASWVPHSVIHAAFLPVRAYHIFGFGGKDNFSELHPYADVLERYVSPIAFRVLGQHK